MRELKDFTLLSRLHDDQLEKVRKRGRVIELDTHAVLHTPHDSCKNVSFVLAGRLAISRILPSGKEYVIRTLSEGDSFGEMVAFSRDAAYPGWIIAASSCTVLEIENTLLLECMGDREFLQAFLEELSRHTLHLLQRLEFLNLKTIRQKIAGYLLSRLDTVYGAAPNDWDGAYPLSKIPKEPMVAAVPKAQLAKLLGNSREAVSRELARLEKEGVLERKGRNVNILNVHRLEEILMDEEG